MRKLVSLKLSKQSVPTKIENGRHTQTAMTGNPLFLSPLPTMLAFGTALTNLENAYTNALAGGKLLTAILHEKEAIVDTLYTQLSHYVEAIANGVESVILSAGMNVKATKGRSTSGFVIKKGILPTQLKLSTTYLRSHAYVWQMVLDPLPDETAAIDPTHTWIQIGITTKASFVMDGLVLGKKYWFRVANIGKAEQSVWSDPLPKTVSE